MALASFKQQCPSCEVMVSIKDKSFVGRKVICPRCQYKFVVTEPAVETQEDATEDAGIDGMPNLDETPAEPKTNAKKPVAASSKAAPNTAKVTPAKGKPVTRKQGKKDKVAASGRSGKKKRLSGTILVGGGLAVVAVIAVAGVIVYMAGGFSLFRPTKPTVRARPPIVVTTKPDEVKVVVPTVEEEITSLLPKDVEALYSFTGEKLFSTDLEYAAFDTPDTFGKFLKARFNKNLGFAPNDLSHFVRAENLKKNWSYNVIVTREPINRDAVAKALGLQEVKKQGDDSYFLVTGNDQFRELGNLMALLNRQVDETGRALPGAAARQMGLYFVKDRSRDSVTAIKDRAMIIADKALLEERLYDRGLPPAGGYYANSSSAVKLVHHELEASGPAVFMVVLETQKAGGILDQFVQALHLESPQDQHLLAFLKSTRVIGLALLKMDRVKISGVLVFECNDKPAAENVAGLLRDGTRQTQTTKVLAELIGLDPSSVKGTLNATANGNVVRADIELAITGAGQRVLEHLKSKTALLKGRVGMVQRNAHMRELADALLAYTREKGQFPRGTYLPAAASGSVTPPVPAQRLSWMIDLLPYLPQFDVSRDQFPADGKKLPLKLELKDSWHGDENIRAAAILIPQFLAADSTEAAWWIRCPGMKTDVAATHFVGMAGVGMDAADYSAQDSSVAKKLGIFGYDRETKLEDIKDGLDKTIALIQVPANYKTPWIAGGGSTIRGVPEKDSIKPFICVEREGKHGTYAIMADGKVRFVPETISDADFQALCTINGGETVAVDEVAPVVSEPGK